MMTTGLVIDWQQVAGFLAAISIAVGAFGYVVRWIVQREFTEFRKDLNGVLDERIDARIRDQVSPVSTKVDHIDDELSRHIEGYRRAG